MTASQLIEELKKFPASADVSFGQGQLIIAKTDGELERVYDVFVMGDIHGSIAGDETYIPKQPIPAHEWCVARIR